MAMHLGLPSPEPLDLSSGNVSESWKKFKQKYSNYEIATGIHTKESATRVVTFLTIIGNDAIDVFDTLTWDSVGDDKKIEKVIQKFEEFCEPRKNVSYQQYKFFCRAQESDETIDQYVTVLRKLSETCEFGTLKNSLIKDRIVLGVNNVKTRERLLRVPDLTLEKALDVVRSAEATEKQIKDLGTDASVYGVKREKITPPNRKTPQNNDLEEDVQLQKLWNKTWRKGMPCLWQNMSPLLQTTSFSKHVQVKKKRSWSNSRSGGRARLRVNLVCRCYHHRSSTPG